MIARYCFWAERYHVGRPEWCTNCGKCSCFMEKGENK